MTNTLELKKKAGAYLAALRHNNDMTQKELADALNYEYYTFISQVEMGAARVPPDRLGDWAKALSIPVDMLAETLLRYYEPHYYAALSGRMV